MRDKVTATIGVFDGVHLGHQEILKRLVREAKRLKTKSLVMTFYPHPRKILNPFANVPLLTSLEHRVKLIKNMGVDFCLPIRFTKHLSQIKAEDFIKKMLITKLAISSLVVGENFLFGYKEEGDFRFLKRMGKKYGFHLYAVSPVKVKGRFVSSTRIRQLLEKGDLKNASMMLGRPVTVLGTVVKGKEIGRKLGFRTANIDPHHEAIAPSGVYAVDAKINKKLYRGVLNIGIRPTFSEHKEPVVELHLLNFKKDIYGEDIEIAFKKKIRNERRFNSLEALRSQIAKDILTVRCL